MKRPLGALLTLAATLLAGCATEPVDTGDLPDLAPPVAELLCLHENHCNYEATLNPPARQANELSISVNPTDPLNIIATGKDYTPDEAGDCVWSGLYTTKDGGLTWKNQNVPGSPWKKLSDPTAPANDFSKFWCATDPVVQFGPDGTAYWTVMPYQCDRISGSKTGRGVIPDNPVVEDKGGFNDWFWTCSSMYVLVSHDGGTNWLEWQEVAFGPRLEHDKQWIATAPNGNVLLCWDRTTDYADSGTAADQLDPGRNTMVCSVSTDKGRSWSEYQAMNAPSTAPNAEPDWAGFLPAVEYSPDDVAYATAVGIDEIWFLKSNDGLAWSDPLKVGNYTDPPPGGEYAWPVLRGSAFRMFAVPSIAVDHSDGPNRGTVYITWFDHASGEGEVRLVYSRDGGATWNETARIPDDDPEKKFDQFMPAVSVGPDGTVDLSWYDRRDDPENHKFDLYYAYSKDGGVTWSPNLRVSQVSVDEQYSHHQNGMIFLGDYRDQESSELGAHLVWVDTRNEKADVFTAIVKR